MWDLFFAINKSYSILPDLIGQAGFFPQEVLSLDYLNDASECEPDLRAFCFRKIVDGRVGRVIAHRERTKLGIKSDWGRFQLPSTHDRADHRVL